MEFDNLWKNFQGLARQQELVKAQERPRFIEAFRTAAEEATRTEDQKRIRRLAYVLANG